MPSSFVTFSLHFLLFHFFFLFLWPRLQHMDVHGAGVKLELQLLANTTVTAKLDSSCICNLRRSLQQHRILNPLSKARDRTCVFHVGFLTHWAILATPSPHFLSQKLRGQLDQPPLKVTVSLWLIFRLHCLKRPCTHISSGEAHLHPVGEFTHYWPQACKREDGYESKGKLEKKKLRSDGATRGPCITPESSTVSQGTHRALPHLHHEKSFLSANILEHYVKMCRAGINLASVRIIASLQKFASALSS